MELSEKERLTIANTCYALVSGRFADMIKKENKGRKFYWNDFPDLMADRCATEIFLYIDMSDYSDEEKDLLENTARNFGKEISVSLVSRSGLADFD